MKISPVNGPHVIQPISTTPNADARSKAIEKFLTPPPTSPGPGTAQSAVAPVENANAVSAEELGAIKAPTLANEQVAKPASEQQTEQVSTTTEEKAKQDPAVIKHFEKLAKQERALRAKAAQQQEQWKQKEAEIKAKEEALAAKEREYQTNYISRQQLKQNTLQALAEAEISYDDLTNQILNQTPSNPKTEAHIQRLEAKIAELEQKTASTQKTWEQQQQDSYKTAIKQIENDARTLIKQDPSTYEAIAKTNSVKAVVKLIEETYHKDGILLSVEEAAEEIENHLVDESIKTVSNIDKIKKRIAQATGQTVKPQGQQILQPNTAQQQTLKTLTNSIASTRKLSARERALLAFKGELKP